MVWVGTAVYLDNVRAGVAFELISNQAHVADPQTLLSAITGHDPTVNPIPDDRHWLSATTNAQEPS